MNPEDRAKEKRDEPKTEERERPLAPPIEREHETLQGALEADEKRERERKPD